MEIEKITTEIISEKIYIIRDLKVMIDVDLANLYDVETKRLNEQVKRNISRFPDDFMFKLTKKEFEDLRSQNATFKLKARNYLPYVFTEQGVAMLSSVLNSERAIKINIAIMRTFIQLRQLIDTNKELALKIEQIEKHLIERLDDHEHAIKKIYDIIQDMKKIEIPKKRQIGFTKNNDNGA